MRRTGLLAFVSLLTLAGTAEAQQPPPPGQPEKPLAPLTPRPNIGGPEAEAARGKARGGDCAGALPLFDQAIKTSKESTLRRDRGLCHDKLGNAFPAVEDYRAYLEASPNAPDGDMIRERLAQLEPKTQSNQRIENVSKAATAASEETSADVYARQRHGDDGKKGVIGPKAGEPEYQYEYYKEQERLVDEADKSPLRNGRGLVLGLGIQIPRYFFVNGNTSDIGYSVAAAVRYSAGRLVSIIGEIGYAGIGTVGERTSQSAPLFMGGLEIRIPFNKLGSDHALLRGGIGYERYVLQDNRFITHDLLGRFALGYRHVFGPSFGFEVLADGGPVIQFPERGDSSVGFYIAGSVGLVVGF